MHDLNRRFIASSILIAGTVTLLLFAFHPLVQYLVVGVVAALTGVATWEYGQFGKAKGSSVILPALIAVTICDVLSFFFAAKHASLQSLPLVVFFIGFLILFALHFKEKEGAVVDLAVSSFGLLYIAIPMGMLLGILYLMGQDGRWWIAYLTVVTKIADVGAYFAGNLWGRRKLAPRISPGKTVEGAVFGLLCALVASFAFHLLSIYLGALQFHLGTAEWMILGLLFGLIGQFGDLSESLLKRDANKKDSNALPGLGGVLDSIDSLLFNAPILFIYLHFIKT